MFIKAQHFMCRIFSHLGEGQSFLQHSCKITLFELNTPQHCSPFLIFNYYLFGVNPLAGEGFKVIQKFVSKKMIP